VPTNKNLVLAANGFPAQNYNPANGDYEESYATNNAIHVKITDANGNPLDGRIIMPYSQDVVFQNNVSVTGVGNTLTVNGMKTLLVEVFGTATSGTVNFMGASISGNYTSIIGTNVSNANLPFAASTSTVSATPQLWQFDLTGLKTVQMQIGAVAGGNIMVQGTVVAI
jgi:hypothetical protein